MHARTHTHTRTHTRAGLNVREKAKRPFPKTFHTLVFFCMQVTPSGWRQSSGWNKWAKDSDQSKHIASVRWKKVILAWGKEKECFWISPHLVPGGKFNSNGRMQNSLSVHWLWHVVLKILAHIVLFLSRYLSFIVTSDKNPRRISVQAVNVIN